MSSSSRRNVKMISPAALVCSLFCISVALVAAQHDQPAAVSCECEPVNQVRDGNFGWKNCCEEAFNSASASEDGTPEHVERVLSLPDAAIPADSNDAIPESEPKPSTLVPDGATGRPTVVEFRFGSQRNETASGGGRGLHSDRISLLSSLFLLPLAFFFVR